jgi:excisionase family DNA binding protein
MEPYLTIKELAEVLRLSEQTIQRYVLNREIPYLKIKKVIRFRPADIEEWAEKGGLADRADKTGNLEGDLFAGIDNPPAEESNTGQTEGTVETCCPPVADSCENKETGAAGTGEEKA